MVLTYSTTLGGTTLALPLSGGSVTVNWGDGTTNTSCPTRTLARGLHGLDLGHGDPFRVLPGSCAEYIGS